MNSSLPRHASLNVWAQPEARERLDVAPPAFLSLSLRRRLLAFVLLVLSLLIILIALVAWLGVVVRGQRRELNIFKARATGRSQPPRNRHSRHPLLTPPQNAEVLLSLGLPAVKGYSGFGSLFRGSGSWVVKNSAAEVAASDASWASSGGLSDHIVTSAVDQIYILGGQGIGDPSADGADLSAPLSAALWQYDAVFENYTRLAPMPYPVTRFSATLANGKLYVAGGIGGDLGLGTCWNLTAQCAASGTNMANGGDAGSANPGRCGGHTLVYSVAANRWAAGPPLNVPRSDSCAVTLGSKVYVAGGYTEGYNISDAFEVLDTAAAAPAWSLLASLPQPRGDVSCVALNGLVYVIGGFYDDDCALGNCFLTQSAFNSNGDSKFRNTTWSYNPASNAWTRRAEMHYHRADHAVAVLPNGRVVAAGGEHTHRSLDSKVPQHSVEMYYAADDVWAEKAPMPYARFRFSMAGVGQSAFAFGGQQLCFGTSNNCSMTAANTVSVLYELDHPDVFVQLSNKAGAPPLTEDGDLTSDEN